MKRWYVIGVLGVLSVAGACAAPGPTLSERSSGEPDAPDQQEVIEAPGEVALVDEAGPLPLRIAVVGQPVVDTAQASVVSPTDMVALDLLYDGLTSWDTATGTWVPALADSIAPSADGLLWTVQLGDHHFSDGSPITAVDVERSLQRLMAAPDSIAGRRLDVVAELSVLDDRTLEIWLDEPYAPLPGLLTSPVFGVVPDGALDGTVGSGPVPLGVDQEVQFVEVTSEAAAIESYTRGAVDVVFVSPAYDGVVGVSALSGVEVQFALNVTAPALLDRQVRQVVVGGVDPSPVAAAGYGPAGTGFPAADALPGGTAELPYPVGRVSVAYVQDELGREAAMAEALTEQLASVRVPAAASGLELDAFVDLVAQGNHQVIRTGTIGLFPSPDSRLATYLSDSADNVTGYASEEFDTLVHNARLTGSIQAYADAWALLEADAVVLPIATVQIRALVGDGVTGLVLRHDGSFDISAVSTVSS